MGIRVVAAAFWLGTLFGGCGFDVNERPGLKDAGSEPSGDHVLGPFTVTVGEDGAFEVRHEAAPDRVLSASPEGASFVEALKVTDRIDEASGSFQIQENIRARCASLQAVNVTRTREELTVDAKLVCDEQRANVSLTFRAQSKNALALTLAIDSQDFNQVALHQAATQQERFVGFGEQFSYLNLRGHAFPVIVQEGGVGRAGAIAEQFDSLIKGTGGSEYSTYAPMPYYLTSQGRALLLENDEVSYFDLTQDDRAIVRVRGKEMRAQVLFGEEPADVIEALTAITGRMDKLPAWVHQGAIVGMQGGTARVRDVLEKLESHDTPLAAFWLQDWVGKRDTAFGSRLWWNWQLNQDQYPGWSKLLKELDARDVRVMTYINPYLVDVAGDPAFTRNLYHEAKSAGYLVETKAGDPYEQMSGTFGFAMVDLTNARASRWLKDVIRDEVIGAGASGYMADFGEALAFDARIEDGEAAVVHNRFPELWARLNRELLQEEGLEGEAVFFSRAGYTRSPSYSSLFWAGDQMVTWDEHDGIKSAVVGLLSSGLSGMSLNHTDIGGYTAFGATVRSKELLLRWMELAAFTPVYRTHEGNQPTANAQIYDDRESLAHFAHFARIFAALADYRSDLMKRAAQTGLPLVRPLLLLAPHDPDAWEQDREFMLGDDLLIAPVLDADATRVTAYLPEGEWIHLWSGDAYHGGEVEVSAPLGQPGVFYRKGSDAGKALRAVK